MLKITKLLTIFSIFSALTFSFALTSCSFAAPKDKTIPIKSEVKNSSKIIVYYFYAKPRCASCKKIEAYTKEAVESMNKSNIQYRAIDLDNKANSRYSKDYKLFTKAVVLSKVEKGKEVKWKNLDGIWTKLNNETEFKNYIKKEVKNFGG
ncbi:MAG: nitrophenyl compound nitroreductase subunit ArsF family protein [Candidatus Gastranaerophilales bacterium]|nr:nitrophenyl compound nitroreductase subunit ArsF family protein [Candidatus Gastranaerophilales bacterium]